MDVRIEESWRRQLQPEFSKPYFLELINFVKTEYKSKTIYPPGRLIFNAFDQCSFDDLKVVIIGQDPYHGEGQANGLCFSVDDGVRQPPSLQNIFKERENDLGIPAQVSGNLEFWAKQGILMLNATLTVRANSPGSHQNKGWEQFTDSVIALVSEMKENVVFILWGAYAQKKAAIVDRNKHFIIESAHPSPFAAHKGFFGSKPFSKCNEFLFSKGLKTIKW